MELWLQLCNVLLKGLENSESPREGDDMLLS